MDGTLQAAGATQATITGSAGVNTVLVNAGATLSASGDLGDGNDVVTLAGTLDTGAGSLNLGAGDDALTLNDGAVISGAGVDAGAADDERRSDPEQRRRADLRWRGDRRIRNADQAEQRHCHDDGQPELQRRHDDQRRTLDIDGTLQTPTLALADGTTLNVDGTVQAAGATQAAITGSSAPTRSL